MTPTTKTKTKTDAVSQRAVAASLSQRLATGKISTKTVNALAQELTKSKFLPKRIDVCQYGICLDYHIKQTQLDNLIKDLKDFRVIEVFPWGIPNPEELMIKVERFVERG